MIYDHHPSNWAILTCLPRGEYPYRVGQYWLLGVSNSVLSADHKVILKGLYIYNIYILYIN